MGRKQLANASMAAGIAVNLGAGFAIYFLTESILSAALSVALIELVLIAVLWRQLEGRPRVPGVQQYAGSSPVGSDLLAIAESVASEFVFWGISAKTIIHSDDFRNVIIQKARGNTRFRFLILDPDSDCVALRAAEEGDTATGWKREIEANIDRLLQMRDQLGLNIDIRLFDAWPVFRLIFVNDHTLYFGWYPHASQGIHSPLVVTANMNSRPSLYDPIRRLFNDFWNHGKEVANR